MTPSNMPLKLSLAEGDEGTLQTLASMAGLAIQAADHPDFIEWLDRQFYHDNNPVVAAQRVFGFLKTNTKYRDDPAGQELVRHPIEMARMIDRAREAKVIDDKGDGRAAVDCDDIATFGAAALMVMGHRAVLRVMARRQGIDYEHVYFGVVSSGVVLPIDPQECGTPFVELPAARRFTLEV